MLNQLIEELGRELAMEESITQNEDNAYRLPFDKDIEVEVIQLERSFILKGVIAPCPQENVEPFLFKIMEENLFGIGTRGAVIGLKDEGNLLTLSHELDYNITYKEFKEKLEDFISVINFWRGEALKPQ